MILKDGKNYRDDQVILNVLAHRNSGGVSIMPREFNWLRLDGDANPDAVCVHWTGGRGKEIVRAKMDGKYLREHFIADVANARGWRRGLEIGTWRGRTFLHLLKNCPSLTMTTIDLWKPQPENQGPERYTPDEGWDHAKNEEHVRSEATMYGARAVILKGNSREIVPRLDGGFDFAFVDGDHGSDAVEADIRNAMWKLSLGGVLFGHDIDWPSVREAVERVFTRYTKGPDNVWYVRVGDVFGPHGCPVGAVGVDGPSGA
jgi:predicted O-methyltransferase YrrM